MQKDNHLMASFPGQPG